VARHSAPKNGREVLPDRDAWNNPGVVSADGGAEVRQLESEGLSTAEEEGHSRVAALSKLHIDANSWEYLGDDFLDRTGSSQHGSQS